MSAMLERFPTLGPAVRFLVYGMLLCLPVSVAGVNLLGGLAVTLILVSREFWAAAGKVFRNRVALAAIGLWLALLVGMSYTSGPQGEAVAMVMKYRKLLFIPLLFPFFREERQRRVAIASFAFSIFVTLLISWTEFLGWTHLSDPAYGGPPGDAVFRMHITQGFLFSLLIVFCLSEAFNASTRLVLWSCLAVALLAAADIAWVMAARTGKATLPAVFVWAAWEWMRHSRFQARFLWFATAAILAAAVCVTAWVAANPATTLGSAHTEIRESLQSGAITSGGLRMEFYRKSLQLISHRPFTGYGTGSLETETGRLASHATTEVGKIATVNTHDEFLMWAVQLGIPGLLLFFLFCFSAFHSALATASVSAQMLRGTWIVFLAGSLINSYLYDFTEGYSLTLLTGILLPL
jgi:O-antigen ligase